MVPAPAPFPSTVLVVDDEQAVIDLLTALFRKHQLECKGALSAEEALVVLEGERVGCLVADKNLPGLSGLELIRRTRQLQPHCACVLMTGFPTAESVLEALRLGATDYLEKPFPELGLVVQRVQASMAHARTAFEREALAQTLREMRTRLKRSEEAVFQRQTELDVFVQVLELRVDEATQSLQVQNGRLQAELLELRDKLLQRVTLNGRLAESLKVLAARASAAAASPTLSTDSAQQTLASLERTLLETAEQLVG